MAVGSRRPTSNRYSSIIGAGNFIASVEKTLVVDDGKASRLCNWTGADTKILNFDALLLL
jgi:hypothetical protein